MSRSGYTDDCDNLAMWRGAVRSATLGTRGQALLRDLLAALDAMPEKALVAGELEADGDYCALGALGKVRGVELSKLDPEDWDTVAAEFNIAPALAREIVYENDEGGRWDETPQQRWARVRAWVSNQVAAHAPLAQRKARTKEKQ